MDDLDAVFQVYKEYGVLICKPCGYAVPPHQVRTHLSERHKQLSKAQRRSMVDATSTNLRLARRANDVLYPHAERAPIDGLPVYANGFRCTWSEGGRQAQCVYVCRNVIGMQRHCRAEHGWTNVQKRGGDTRQKRKETPNKLWERGCAYQQFFREKSWIRLFEVNRTSAKVTSDDRYCPLSGVSAFFDRQEADISQAKQDGIDQANVVRGFGDHRSTVVPWLKTTGVAHHLDSLKKDEIHSATQLPSDSDEPALSALLDAFDTLLHEAHRWCFDGPDCLLTWPCRVVLSGFHQAPTESSSKTRAFEPHKNPSTLKTYFRLAKRLLAYLYRITRGDQHHFSPNPDHPERRPEEVVQLTVEQRSLWIILVQMAERHSGLPDRTHSPPPAELQDKLVEMWMLLVCHETGSRRYSSPLVSFCAMLSVKSAAAGWMEPGNFNSHLSALIWVVQLLIFYDSARRERAGSGSTFKLVQRQCKKYLQQATETPMGEILRWRLLLFHVSRNTVGTHQAEWDAAEQVLSFEGVQLDMDHIPTLLVSEYRSCRDLLYQDLMLNVTDCRRMHAWTLKDRPDVDTIGWSFLQHAKNEQILKGSDRALLHAIRSSPQLCQLFLQSSPPSSTGWVWRDSALASYEATAQDFLKRLSVLIHISSGQPAREGEFLSMTWRNTERPRSITLRHDRLMIYLTYHKGQQQTGQNKDNVRFLAHSISDLLLDYLVYVLPLRQIFLRQTSPAAVLPAFLWEKHGRVWPDQTLSRCLEAASVRAEIPRLHIANWRQMTVAIVKTKFASDLACFEGDANDEDAEELDVDIQAMTKQRNHKTQTVNRAYANQTGSAFGNVWDGLIRMGLRASTLWQDFWGVDAILTDKKRVREGDGDDSRLSKRIAMGIYRPRKPWSSEALLGALQKLYGSDGVQWKSVEQEQALGLIMSWTEQVVAVLPTGAGKSVLFMLPCTLPDAGVTVLIVPLVALRGDLLRRLAELDIPHLQWLPGEKREAKLVLVTAEAASTQEFLGYCQALAAQQKLDRIVVDECHLTVTAAQYRKSVEDLSIVRTLRTQFVYLTATMPPTIQAEFEERNHLYHPKVVRAASNRPNIIYTVRTAQRGAGSLFQQAAYEAQRLQTQSDRFDPRQDKILLYVRTREDATELATLLQCGAYTARSGSHNEKSAIVSTWIQSATQPCLVATTAFAEGFDYPHVRMVINVHEPDSLVLFAQESGRAGRDGQPAYSLVLLPSTWDSHSEGTDPSEDGFLPATRDASLGRQRERRAMRRYLASEQCFRTSLSEHLDHTQDRRWCMTGDLACGVYYTSHAEPIPPIEKGPPTATAQQRHTGEAIVRRVQSEEHSQLTRYREDLLAVQGSCMLCRIREDAWDHPFHTCPYRFDVFRVRNELRARLQQRRRQWLAPFAACFRCLNPQSICGQADPESTTLGQECEAKDVVLPLCYSLFGTPRGPEWLHQQFGRRFENLSDFLEWAGESSPFGGGLAI